MYVCKFNPLPQDMRRGFLFFRELMFEIYNINVFEVLQIYYRISSALLKNAEIQHNASYF
jgi:hypothetical protein